MEKVDLETFLKLDLRGQVFCFPTDTVYGVGALYDDHDAISRIFKLKHRDLKKPLALLTATKDIGEYVEEVSEAAKELMNTRWPGALTLIFNKSDKISDEVTNGFKTIAFRMPNSKIALKILKKFGLIATTSVNISGREPLNSVSEIEKYFADAIDYIVTNTEISSLVPSEILDVTSKEIKKIR